MTDKKYFFVYLVVLGLFGHNGCSAASYELKKDNKTCLIVQSEATLNVDYLNTMGQWSMATWPLGDAVSVGGACDFESAGGQASSLNLTFDTYWLELQFANRSGQAHLAGIALTLDVQNSSRFVNPNATGLMSLTGQPDLPLSPVTEYFACQAAVRLNFTASIGGSFLTLADTQLQAFNVLNGSFSDKFATCAQDATTAVPETTAAPETNTTTAAPVTTVMPTTSPPSEPPLLNFTVLDPLTGVACVQLQLRATLAIVYGLAGGAGNATARLPVPASARVVSGGPADCGNASQTVRLSLYGSWLMELGFAVQEAGGYSLHRLSLSYQLSPGGLFPNASAPGRNASAAGNRTYFSVGTGRDYYTCAAAQQLRLDGSVALETRNLQAQAFRARNTTEMFYGTAVQCKDDLPIDNVVPIVVGAALAGLVIIVLIAYLIGRRRHSSGGGYQSV